MFSDGFDDVPEVAAGVNPFTVYRHTLWSIVYPTPSNGFDARVNVLLALSAYSLVISVAYLALVPLAYKQQGKRVWLWQRVQQGRGAQWLANLSLIWPLCSILSATTELVYVYRMRSVYKDRGTQHNFWFWRGLVVLPMIFQAYMAVSCMLQAALLTQHHTRVSRWMPPRISNLVFICLLAFVVILPNFVLALVVGSLFNHLLSHGVEYDVELATMQTKWDDDTATEADFAQVAEGLRELLSELHRLADFALALYCLYAFTVLVILLLCSAGFGLLHQLRKHLQLHAQLASLQGGASGVVVTLTSASPAGGEAESPEKLASASTPLEGASEPSRAPPNGSPVTELGTMRKLHRDLLVFTIAITVAGCVFFAMCVYFAVNVDKLNTSWDWTEVPLTNPLWIYLPSLSVANSILLVILVRHIWVERTRQRRHRAAVALPERLSRHVAL